MKKETISNPGRDQISSLNDRIFPNNSWTMTYEYTINIPLFLAAFTHSKI